MSAELLTNTEQSYGRWSVMPEFKLGVTVHAMAALLHKISAGHSKEKSFSDIYGLYKSNVEPGDPLGRSAENTAKIFFGNQKSSVEIIRQHTVSGIFDLLLPTGWRGMRSNVLRGHVTGRNPTAVNYIKDATKPMAWCPLCVERDLDEKGWAAWYAAHQVPFIHHCHMHRVPLLSRCNNCDQPVDTGVSWRLPGRACHQCGQQKYVGFVVEESDGYISLLTSFSNILRLAVQQPNEAICWDFISKALEGGKAKDSAILFNANGRLCEQWSVDSVLDIPGILGVHGWSGKHPELIWYGYEDNPLRSLLLFDIIKDFR